MRRINIALLLTVVFLIGCVTTMAVKDLVIPPAKADSSAQRWEVFCIFRAGEDEFVQKAKEAGLERWEPYATWESSQGSMVKGCFKRVLE